MTSPSEVLARVEAACHQHFETEPSRASVSFVGVDPIEVLLYQQTYSHSPSVSSYVTLGMSRHPMVGADAEVLSADGPRAELMLTISGRSTDGAWRRLAVLAAAPAVESVVYAPLARIDLGEAWLPGSRCTGAVISAGQMLPVPIDRGQVDIFRVIPVTSTELAWARVHGTESLIERWDASGTELQDLFREPVDLT